MANSLDGQDWPKMALLLVIAITLLATPDVCAQTIGVFSNPQGTDCQIEVPEPGVPVTVYVVGTLTGTSSTGVSSAILRIEGLPAGWTADVTLDPQAAVAIGDPFERGIQIAYAGNIFGESLLLLTVRITASTIIENGSLSVVAHMDIPDSCGFEGGDCGEPCPRFCHSGSLSQVCYCAQGYTSSVNGAPCTVGVSTGTWEHVKQLYW